jgi:beta-glucosidase
MVTGMFGPQTDLDRLPNWGRNLTTTGEDPYLSHQMVAAQINGMQGVGAMSEMKHFVVYNGQNQNLNTAIQDQGLWELYTPRTKAVSSTAGRQPRCARTSSGATPRPTCPRIRPRPATRPASRR